MFVEVSYKVGQWVVVIFEKEWYVREVCSVEDVMIQVKCMKRIGGNLNKFAWPDKDDISWFTPTEILCNVDPAVPATSRAFALFQKNNDFINSCLEIYIDHKYFIKNMDWFYFVLFPEPIYYIFL